MPDLAPREASVIAQIRDPVADSHSVVGLAAAEPISQGAGLDVRALLMRLVYGSPVIALTICLGLWGGFSAMNALSPRYTSSISLLIDPKRPGAFGADAAFANLMVDAGKIASVEMILTSSELLTRVVRSEHLADDPGFGEAYPSARRRWLSGLSPKRFPEPLNSPAARESRAVWNLGRMMRTSRVGATYVITISLTAPTAIMAQRLAKEVVNAYLADQIETKFAAANRDGLWLSKRLEQVRRDLTDSENEVEEVRRRYRLMETDRAPGSTIDQQAATDINTQLQQAEGLAAASGAKYEQAMQVIRSHGNVSGLPDVASSGIIAGLRSQEADLNRRVANLASRYTPEYPERAHAEADRNTLEHQISIESARIVDRLRNQYQTDVALRDTLRARLATLVAGVGGADNADGRIKLRQAERGVEANQAAYAAALARLRDVQQQESRQEAEVRVISDADLPDAPSFPKPVLLLGGGAGVGLLAGVAMVLLVPLLRRPRVDASSASSVSGLPLLALSPYLRQKDLGLDAGVNIPDYLLSHPFSPFADCLRLLRAGLRTKSRSAQVIQFTSADQGEGKSTLAASVAVSAAMAGLKTAIVDLDSYHPSIASLLGIERDGMTIYSSPRAVENRGAAARFAKLPLRLINPHVSDEPLADLLEQTAFENLMKQLRNDFDIIILDTPPVLAVSDAILITRMADATVIVCAWRATTRHSVSRAVAALREAGAPLIGLVLNKVPQRTRSSYYGTYNDYRGKRIVA